MALATPTTGEKVSKSELQDGLYLIDERYRSDKPLSERPKKDAEFYLACTASTQRIRSRRTRDSYIRKYLGI